MPQRFLRNSTVKVAELLQQTISELAALRRGVVTPEIILMTLIEQQDSVFLKILDELRLDTDDTRRHIVDKLMQTVGDIPQLQFGHAAAMKISQEVQNLFEQADKERATLEDSYISTAALLLAFFHDSVGVSKTILEAEGLNYAEVLKALKQLRGNSKIVEKDSESRASLLDQYTTDMTALARKNQLDPVVGREKEVRRTIEILSRRKKNNRF